MIIAIRVNDEFETDLGKVKVLKVEEDDTVIALGERTLKGSPYEAIEFLNANNAKRYERKGT